MFSFATNNIKLGDEQLGEETGGFQEVITNKSADVPQPIITPLRLRHGMKIGTSSFDGVLNQVPRRSFCREQLLQSTRTSFVLSVLRAFQILTMRPLNRMRQAPSRSPPEPPGTPSQFLHCHHKLFGRCKVHQIAEQPSLTLFIEQVTWDNKYL